MPPTPGSVQNVLNAYPVRYKIPPPEGPRALPIAFQLQPGQQLFTQMINLSDWGMSQAVAAIIDNTQSTVDLTVTMGVTGANVVVPAGAGIVCPVFSNGPLFNILVQAEQSPGITEFIVITLLNFEKTAQEWSFAPIQVFGNLNANITNASIAVTGTVDANITGGSVAISSGTVNATITNSSVTVISNIQNTPHNSGLLCAGAYGFAGNNTVFLFGGGSSGFFFLDSLDCAVEVGSGALAGVWGCNVIIGSWTGAAIDTIVHYMHPQANMTVGGQTVPGVGLTFPSYRTWPQGLKVPTGAGNQMVLQVNSQSNFGSLTIRVNISGYAP